MDETDGLPLRQSKQVFDGQTELNSSTSRSASVRVYPVESLARHVRIQPDGQGAVLDRDSVVGFPVGRAVAFRGRLGHFTILPSGDASRFVQHISSEYPLAKDVRISYVDALWLTFTACFDQLSVIKRKA